MTDRDMLIAQWLSQYVEPADGGRVINDVDTIKDGIALLLENGIMTADEMREEAVRDYGVVIPMGYFPPTKRLSFPQKEEDE